MINKIYDCVTFYNENLQFDLRFNILEKKFSPDFPGLSIKEIIGGMKILDKWLN